MDVDRMFRSNTKELARLRSRERLVDDGHGVQTTATKTVPHSTLTSSSSQPTAATSSSTVPENIKKPKVDKMMRLMTSRNWNTQANLSRRSSQVTLPIMPQSPSSADLEEYLPKAPQMSKSAQQSPPSHRPSLTANPPHPVPDKTIPGAFPEQKFMDPNMAPSREPHLMSQIPNTFVREPHHPYSRIQTTTPASKSKVHEPAPDKKFAEGPLQSTEHSPESPCQTPERISHTQDDAGTSRNAHDKPSKMDMAPAEKSVALAYHDESTASMAPSRPANPERVAPHPSNISQTIFSDIPPLPSCNFVPRSIIPRAASTSQTSQSIWPPPKAHPSSASGSRIPHSTSQIASPSPKDRFDRRHSPPTVQPRRDNVTQLRGHTVDDKSPHDFQSQNPLSIAGKDLVQSLPDTGFVFPGRCCQWKLFRLISACLCLLALPLLIAPCSIWFYDIKKDASELLHTLDRYDNFVASQTIHTIWTNTSTLSEVVCNLDDWHCFLRESGSFSVDDLWFLQRTDRLFASESFPIPCPTRSCGPKPGALSRLSNSNRLHLADLLEIQILRILAILQTMLDLGEVAREKSRNLKDMASHLSTELNGSGWPWVMIESAEALYDVPSHCNQAGLMGCGLWLFSWRIIKTILPNSMIQSSRLHLIEARHRQHISFLVTKLNALPSFEVLQRACKSTQNELEAALQTYGYSREMELMTTSISQACSLPSIMIPINSNIKEETLSISQALLALLREQHLGGGGIGVPGLLGVSGAIPLINSTTGQRIGRVDLFIEKTMVALVDGGSREVKRSIDGAEKARLVWQDEVAKSRQL